MNEVATEVVRGLAGNPALLLLCVVLVGGGWIVKAIQELHARITALEGS